VIDRVDTDNVMFGRQHVIYKMELTKPFDTVKWMKDGEQVFAGKKYTLSSSESGRIHILKVRDIEGSDDGIYTFKIVDSWAAARMQMRCKLNRFLMSIIIRLMVLAYLSILITTLS